MKESEEQFRSTFEQAAVGILHTAIDGSFIRVNQKFCDILGYTRKELYGMSFFALTHPDDTNISSDSLQKVFTGVVPMVSFEKRYIRKDSLPVWVNVTSSLKRDASNAPEYFITIVQDISARKNTEMSLILSESRLKSAQSMAHVGNWEIDLATKLLWASEECFNIYGIKYTPALPVIPLLWCRRPCTATTGS